MDDPANEIAHVVKLLTTAPTPDAQKAAVERFFLPNAGFQHPLCTVAPAQNSRESILAIYQWYRIMSPRIDLSVDDVSYNHETKTVFMDITQKFHIFVSPFSPAPARLLVRVELAQIGTQYFIKQQTDFYQPEDILKLLVPPLSIPLSMAKQLASLTCRVNATVFQYLGFWKPKPQVANGSNGDHHFPGDGKWSWQN